MVKRLNRAIPCRFMEAPFQIKTTVQLKQFLTEQGVHCPIESYLQIRGKLDFHVGFAQTTPPTKII